MSSVTKNCCNITIRLSDRRTIAKAPERIKKLKNDHWTIKNCAVNDQKAACEAQKMVKDLSEISIWFFFQIITSGRPPLFLGLPSAFPLLYRLHRKLYFEKFEYAWSIVLQKWKFCFKKSEIGKIKYTRLETRKLETKKGEYLMNDIRP